MRDERTADQSLWAKLKRRFRRHGAEALNLLNPLKNARTLGYQLHLYRLAGRTFKGLHLGCGWSIVKGFCNIDASFTVPCDVVGRVDRLKLSANSVETLYCSHVLEHVRRSKIRNTLSEWRRVLRPGGKIYIGVPDVEKLWRTYLDNLQNYEQPEARAIVDFACDITYGGQSTRYDFHFYGYSFVTLKALLENAGFRDVARFDRSSLAFAPFADAASTARIAGEPVSLNVVAVK